MPVSVNHCPTDFDELIFLFSSLGVNNPRNWRPCSQAVPKTSRRFVLGTRSRSYWTYIPISGGEVADHHNTLIGMLVDRLAHNITEFTRACSSPAGLLTTSYLLTVLLPAACPLHDPFFSLHFPRTMPQSFRHPQAHTEYTVS